MIFLRKFFGIVLAALLSGLGLSLLLTTIVRAQPGRPTAPLARPNISVLAATVYTVTKSSDTNDGTCNADCSLREALVAANGNSGVDTIIIPAGTYNLTSGTNGDIDITSSVIISGAGAGLSIINANFPVTNTDRIFDIMGAGVTLSGVTLRNGKISGGGGGGIQLNSTSTLTLSFSTLYNNSADNGGALRNAGGDVILDNVTIYSNTATNSSGGGIRTENGGGTLLITNSSIYSNTSLSDGGGLFISGGTANIFTTTLGPNNQTLNGHGAGLSVGASAIANLAASNVVSNTAAGDGGGANNLGTLSFTDSLIQANTALSTTGSGNGGGINNQAGDLTLTGVTLNNNMAQGGAGGGGLRNSLSGVVTIVQSTVAGNQATASVGNGGAILLSAGELVVSQSFIGVLGNGNYAGLNGGGISAASGTTVTITSSSVISNSAGDDGGGIDASGTALYVTDTGFISNAIRVGAVGDGGAIRSDSNGTAILVGVTISGNVAEYGGGIVNIDAALTLISSTVSYNSARNGSGGGIDNRRETLTPTLIITGSSIFSNSATNGNGGGLRSIGAGGTASTTIDNSTISYNQVSNGNGGGLRNEGGSVTQLANVTLTYNNRTPSGAGEGVSVNGGSLFLQNTLIANNDSSANNCTGTLTSLNYNLDSGNSCSLVGANDIINTSPNLGVFQNNGGPTWSQPLVSGSAGINQGDPAGCAAAGGGPVMTIDQRGFTRPVGARCDIGAVERINGDVAISLTNNRTSVIPGAPITYTLIVSNLSSTLLTNITVSDSLPAALASLGWSCSATGGSACPASGSGNISATITLAGSGRATFTLTGLTAEAATGTLTHTATAAAPLGYDDPTGNNTASDVDPLTPQADVGITNSDGQTSAIPGTPITYTIVITSAGPSTAPNITISDTLPVALNNVGWSCTPSGGATCLANGSGNLNTAITLTANSQVVFLVTGDIDPTATGALTNTAVITLAGGITGIGSAPDNAQDVTPLNPTVDLGIAKTDSQATTRPGEILTYTLLVSNTGPSQVVNALITDTFPVQLINPQWVCMASAGSTCPASGSGSLNTSISLMPNGMVTLTITSTVALTATGTITNTAYVSPPPGVTETGPLPNQATDTTAVVPFEADLQVTATSPLTATPGLSLTFTVAIRNLGPDATNSAQITDTFPAAMLNPTWSCVASGGAACPANGVGHITTPVSLPVNGVVTFTVSSNLAAGASGVLSHTASAMPPVEFGDPQPQDNQAIVNITLVPQGDLSITLTADQSTVQPGDTLTYTLVVNNPGPSTMINTLVTDTFPANLMNVDWSCSASSGSACPANGSGDIATTIALAPSGIVTFTITAQTTTGGTLTNIATVAAALGALDPNLSNNSVTEVTQVLIFLYLPLLRR